MRVRARAVLALLPALVAAGCGSSGTLPPPAEPARSPLPQSDPAGRIVPVGPGAEGVVADPVTGAVAVAVSEPPSVVLLDGRTLESRRRVRLPAPARHLALAGPGGPVLAPAEKAGVLSVVELPGGAAREVRVGPGPHDAAAAAGRLFVGDEGADTVSVVEGARATERLDAPVAPGGLVAAGNTIGVVGVRERLLAAYDARTLRETGRVDAGIGPTHLVADGPDRLYVVDTQGDALLLFNLRPALELVRRVSLPGSPYGIAADRRRGRLWVTLTERNELVELRAGSRPGPLRSFPTVRQPNSVAVDEASGRVYVTGRADGVIQALDPRDP